MKAVRSPSKPIVIAYTYKGSIDQIVQSSQLYLWELVKKIMPTAVTVINLLNLLNSQLVVVLEPYLYKLVDSETEKTETRKKRMCSSNIQSERDMRNRMQTVERNKYNERMNVHTYVKLDSMRLDDSQVICR